MARLPSPGVLIFDADATIRHVDPAALSVVDTDRASLLDGTADVLTSPVSAFDGSVSYDSLRTYVEQLLDGATSVQSIVLPEHTPAEARVTQGPDGPNGVLVTVQPTTTPQPERDPPSSGPLTADGPLDHQDRLRLLEAAMEHMRVPVLITEAEPLDEPGPRIVYANPAFTDVSGYSVEEVLGRSPRFLQGPDTDADALNRIRRALEDGTPVRETVLNYAKDGTPYWNDIYVAPVCDANGGPTHFVSIQDDVTERRQTQRFRRQQNQLLERIASGRPLQETLTDLIAFLEEERPGMRGSILLYDAEQRTLRHLAAPSLPDTFTNPLDGVAPDPAAGSSGAAVHRNETVITKDIKDADCWANVRDLALKHGLRSSWAVPIHGEDNDILGAFAFYYDEPRTPNDRDYFLIEETSHLAGVAIEHDRQKRELQIQKDQLHRLVENAQPIIFLLDADGTLLMSEGEDLAALGIEAGSHVGQSVYDLYGEHSTMLDYIDRALDGHTVDDVIEIDGVLFDIWYAPYYDRADNVAGCIGMAVDVTNRRATEAALRANRDLLRRTQEVARVGGWEYDPRSDTMQGTEETYRICEIPQGTELTLNQAVSLFPPDTASVLQKAVERCLEHGEPFDEEGPMTTAEGTHRWVRVRGEARRVDEEVTKLVGTVQDLSKRHQMEERLREQKELLQSITENISGGIYRSTEDGLVYANQAFLDLFGYDSLDELVRAEPESLYADPDVRQELLQRETERGGLDGVEIEYQRKDGTTFTGLLRSTQVLDDDGTPLYHDGVVTDITEQKMRERKIREQRQKIEAVYGPSGDLLRANSREEVASCLVALVNDTFGYPEVVVRYAREGHLVPVDLSPEASQHMPERPAFSIEGTSSVARVYRSGETRVVDDARTLEDSFTYGEARAVAGIPLGDFGILTLASFEVGGIDSFDLRLIDILAKKATAVLDRIEHEKNLRASEKQFRGLFEEAAIGIALVDPEGYIVDVNRELASMLGYEPDTLQGRHFLPLTHPDDRDEDQTLFEELVAGERARYEIEKRFLRSNDSVFWGRLTVSQHKGPGEAEVIGMVKDVSDRRQYEQELKEAKQEAEEASRLKSALLANMSHEIRTPLTSIIGFTGVLKDNLSGQDAKYANLAHRGGQRLMETLDSLLQLSKLEAGVTKPVAKRIDLVATARQTVHLYQSQSKAAGVDLRFDPATESLPGKWPPSAVQRVLSNLLSNALKFTPEGGRVTVRVRPTETAAVLEVSDTGVGFSEEFRPRLFDAFTQESEGLKREHEGTGLGLAIVKRLVDLLDGDIDVESTKGEGTLFRIRLPL